MLAKISEKIIQAKKQNKDLGGAAYNDVNDQLVRYSLNSICCYRKRVLLSCSVFKNLKSILMHLQPEVQNQAKWFSV